MPKAFIENLKSLDYTTMTPIQKESLPLILDKKDVIAQAQTGSGKTIAFGIGLVNALEVKDFKIQSLVLCPTRELANQVASEIRKLARFIHNVKVLTLTGGVPYKPQVNSLYHGAHIVVGTPGRVLKHLNEGNISFDRINLAVLDEADKMLDMGFSEDIHQIMQALPQKRQTLLFSATYQDNIDALSKEVLSNPITVSIEKTIKPKIATSFYKTDESSKTSLLPSLFSTYEVQSVVIFCNTKIKCDALYDDLYDLGFDVLVLHSEYEQKERDETLTLFANKSYPILIATDVAARGLDIDDVDMVINYDVPKDATTYTHRIGRTARANKEGNAITLVSDDELELFEDIQDDLETTFEFSDANSLVDNLDFKLDAPFRTLYINGGKKNKVRAGDILGSLIQGVGLTKEDVGKITTFNFFTLVAVKKEVEEKAYKGLTRGKIKGKYFKIYKR